jgi:hypothetical protein
MKGFALGPISSLALLKLTNELLKPNSGKKAVYTARFAKRGRLTIEQAKTASWNLSSPFSQISLGL